MNATIHLNKDDCIAPIDRRMFSSSLEHMGRAIYTGIYEHTHPEANAEGFRLDVKALIAPLGLSHIRYPGGRFLSSYRWEDGVGPHEQRPVRRDLAWQALEPNSVGIDEFAAFCRSLGVSPMLGVNLGTRGAQEAVDLLEYCNVEGGTFLSDLRVENGSAHPHNVRLWRLGNEPDSPWQICAMTAAGYARKALETAMMMKRMDPAIELVVCGGSSRNAPSFGAWTKTVLDECYESVDYLSVCQYYGCTDGDVASFLARGIEMDALIRESACICRSAKARLGAKNDVYLSFDEWNVWHRSQEDCPPPKWTLARPIEEERSNVADALVVGSMLITLLNNADSVKIACMAQLVNVTAPIMTEPGGRAWAQTSYYPFLCVSRWGRGTALRVSLDSPSYICRVSDETPCLDCAAVLSADRRFLTLFTVNRSLTQEIPCALQIAGLQLERVTVSVGLFSYDLDQSNTADATPVVPRLFEQVRITDRGVSLRFPPASWTMVRFAVTNA